MPDSRNAPATPVADAERSAAEGIEMAQALKDKLLGYTEQAQREGIVSLVDETDTPELFDLAVRKIVGDGDRKCSENMLVLRALLAICEGRSPEELDRQVQSLPASQRW